MKCSDWLYWCWKKRRIHKLYEGSSVVQTRKGRIEYAIYGKEGDPIVAVMHGSPGGYDQVPLVMPQLVENGFRVISWSRPGYLRTPLKTGKTIWKQADALAALLDVLGIEKVNLLGVSGGGPASLAFALSYPHRLNTLLLICALTHSYKLSKLSYLMIKIFFHDISQWFYQQLYKIFPHLIVYVLLKLESDFDKKEFSEQLHYILNHASCRVSIEKLLESLSPISLRKNGLYNDLQQFKSLENLPLENIKAPTFVIHGSHDKDAKVDHAALVMQKVPQAEIYWLKDGFHFVWVSPEFQQALKAWFSFMKKHLS